jgi:hypothetical protein
MRTLLVLMLGISVALVGAQGGSRQIVWSGTVGQRQVVVEERWTPPFADITVSVRVSAEGKTSSVDISSAGRSPELVVPSAPERLVLVTGETVSIVDLASTQVADQFFVARPSISPTGRFIAYSRFQPPASQDEDVLLLYDVAASVQQNRLPPNARGEFMRDVGLPVFPEWHVANQKYRGRNETAGAPIETLRSAAVWVNESDFIFLAGRSGSANPNASLGIHHVHIRGGGQPPVLRAQRIDASTLIDGASPLHARSIKVLNCAGNVCEAEIEWVPTPGLRAPSFRVTF